MALLFLIGGLIEVARVATHEPIGWRTLISLDVLPEGPYFLSGTAVHQAWRLYADELRAFVLATVPSSVSRYVQHEVLIDQN